MQKVRFSLINPESKVNIVLAEGELGSEVLDTDGHYYVAPENVKTEYLHKTQDTYHCPYKGTCNYYSVQNPASGATLQEQAAWIYETPMQGWEHIAGRYGFYHHDMNGVKVEVFGTAEA